MNYLMEDLTMVRDALPLLRKQVESKIASGDEDMFVVVDVFDDGDMVPVTTKNGEIVTCENRLLPGLYTDEIADLICELSQNSTTPLTKMDLVDYITFLERKIEKDIETTLQKEIPQ